ncbi:Autophagy-related protein 9A-like [Oopsacas minuta]|uniref:Autophagy-related protein 9 n=1 Tax=Oopsacas minuta TaxID=111878 RepID=A0AAV7JT45_9METZ|nr:Autophagy-related protein 9A-like [Oopsacas minuta]
MSDKDYDLPKPSPWPGIDFNFRSIKDSFSRFIPHKDVPYTQVISEPEDDGFNVTIKQHSATMDHEQGVRLSEHDDQPPSFHSVGGIGNKSVPADSSSIRWERNLNRWKHVKDLDDFFTRIYFFWIEGGYFPLVVSQFLDLFQFLFIFFMIIFLISCVDYAKLVQPSNPENKFNTLDFIQLNNLLNPPLSVIILLLFGIPFWIWRTFKAIYKAIIYLDIRNFYKSALGLDPSKIRNYPWTLIVERLQTFQQEGDGYSLLIKKREMSSLDVYHRILRFENFIVAMVNRKLLPMHFRVPILGKQIFCSQMLLKNYTWILFTAPGSLFHPRYRILDEVRSPLNKDLVVKKLSNRIAYFALFNLLLFPFVLMYQFFYSIFSYADLARKNPSAMGLRLWSLPAKLEYQHFNELQHEQQQRLSRAYVPAKNYLQLYSSPVINLLARHFGFIAGALLALLLFFGFLNENVFFTEYLIKIGSVLGIVVAVCRVLVPPEDLLYEEPKLLLAEVLKHVHYMPDDWKLHPEAQEVMKQFSQLFQFRAILIFHELLSPILTPFILYFALRKRSSEIIDFFRQFTVDVEGLGDVCSFAQLDLQRHGDVEWVQVEETSQLPRQDSDIHIMEAPSSSIAKNGKTELSLLSFSVRNPSWKPPTQSHILLKHLRDDLPVFNSDMIRSTLSDPTNTLPMLDPSNYIQPPPKSTNSSTYQEMQTSRQIMALHRMHETQSSFKPTSSMFFGNWNMPFLPPQSPANSIVSETEIVDPSNRQTPLLSTPVLNSELCDLTEPLIASLDNKVLSNSPRHLSTSNDK